MRPFRIYKGNIVRISKKVDKISMLDWLFHLFGIHLLRISTSGILYCRLCDKFNNQ